MNWDQVRTSLADEPLPTAVIDLDAVDANFDTLVAAMGTTPVTMRIATKSIRHIGLTRHLLQRGGSRFRGLMCFCAREAAFLAEQGFDDLLIAYPFARTDEAELVASLTAVGTRVFATVDHPDHIALLSEAARRHGTTIRVCLDVDVALRAGPAHFGVRRSPIRCVEDATAVGTAIAQASGVRLSAILAYEALVAGVQDRTASKLTDAVIRLLKGRTRPLATQRRLDVVAALEAQGHDIEVVNGGGTGSVGFTAHDGSVTEITAGSGFLCPHLFDGYRDLDLKPAAFFAIQVARISDAGFVTCLGGGYPASGAAGPDRLPIPWLPRGLSAVNMEGFGEVQTPLRWTGRGPAPAIGDPVLCRHAKAGELAERFDSYALVRSGRIVDRQPTYRGMGQTFL